MNDPAGFGPWLARTALKAGYDTAPGAGGRSRLAKAAGVDPSVIGKALDGSVIPNIATQRQIAAALNVPMTDMLIRSGTLTPDDLPREGEAPPPPVADMDLYAVAAMYGIPEERAHLFVASAEALATALATEHEGSSISKPQTGRKSAKR